MFQLEQSRYPVAGILRHADPEGSGTRPGDAYVTDASGNKRPGRQASARITLSVGDGKRSRAAARSAFTNESGGNE